MLGNQGAEMSSIRQIAEQFFDACETGRGWNACQTFCHPGATFSAQTGALADVRTLQAYTDWMKGLFTPLPDARYEVPSRHRQGLFRSWPRSDPRPSAFAGVCDGTIAAFDTATGEFRDYLRDGTGRPIVIDKLWGLAFGNGVSLGDLDSLYFTAGPNEEQDGIFARLRHASSPAY
jgi:hypothetical protein